jgi:hypothetical protein
MDAGVAVARPRRAVKRGMLMRMVVLSVGSEM